MSLVSPFFGTRCIDLMENWDAWLQALDESVSGRKGVGVGLHSAVEVRYLRLPCFSCATNIVDCVLRLSYAVQCRQERTGLRCWAAVNVLSKITSTSPISAPSVTTCPTSTTAAASTMSDCSAAAITRAIITSAAWRPTTLSIRCTFTVTTSINNVSLQRDVIVLARPQRNVGRPTAHRQRYRRRQMMPTDDADRQQMLASKTILAH